MSEKEEKKKTEKCFLKETIRLQKKVILQLLKLNHHYTEIVFTIVTGDGE